MRAAIDRALIAKGGEDITVPAAAPKSGFGTSEAVTRTPTRAHVRGVGTFQTRRERRRNPARGIRGRPGRPICGRAMRHLLFAPSGEVSERLKEHAWKVCVR